MFPPIIKPRIFHGWYILFVLVLTSLIGAGNSQVFFGAMLLPITDDLNWSRSAVAGAVSLGTFVGGIAQPISGALADRYGTRVITSLGILLLGLAFFALASISEVWHLFVSYTIARAITMATISGVPPRTAAVNWFRRKRGRALGIVSTAPALGSAITAIFARSLTGSGVDWRSVFLIFGVASLLMLPLTLGILRRKPEDLGLLPDGAKQEDFDSQVSEDLRVREPAFSLNQARKTTAFWLITFGMSASAFSTGLVSFHMVAFFVDNGLSETVGVISLSTFAFSGALSAILWGFLSEKFSEKLLAIIATGSGTLITLLFLLSSGNVLAVALSALFGFALRGEGALLNIIIAQYFGRISFGAISGFTAPFQMLALSLGPITGSWLFEFNDSWYPVFALGSGVLATATFGLVIMRRPVFLN